MARLRERHIIGGAPELEDAMHIPDGFIDGTTSAGAMAVAGGGVTAALRRTAGIMADRQAPLIGVTAAFVFALQLVNFPVAAGTSGHVLGGVLAAVLVGPAAAVVCLTVVLAVQALLFADGGLSALGLNVVNIALIGGAGGYAVFAALRRVLPRTPRGLSVAAGIAAGLAVVLSALGFVVEYALGGAGEAPLTTVAAAMVGVHALIGIGEGLVTATVVGSVLAARPDLVFGAAGLQGPQGAPAPSALPAPAPAGAPR